MEPKATVSGQLGSKGGCAHRQRLFCKPAWSRANKAARSKLHFPGNLRDWLPPATPSPSPCACMSYKQGRHAPSMSGDRHQHVPAPRLRPRSGHPSSPPALPHRSRVLGAAVSPPHARRVSGGRQPGGTPALSLHFTPKVPALPRGSFSDVSSLSVGSAQELPIRAQISGRPCRSHRWGLRTLRRTPCHQTSALSPLPAPARLCGLRCRLFR